MSNEFIDGIAVQRIWSTANSPLFDRADSAAAVCRDAAGQHYLWVEHWGGSQHVLRITNAEASQVIANNNYRKVFRIHVGEHTKAADRGVLQNTERLQAEMNLKWERR